MKHIKDLPPGNYIAEATHRLIVKKDKMYLETNIRIPNVEHRGMLTTYKEINIKNSHNSDDEDLMRFDSKVG